MQVSLEHSDNHLALAMLEEALDNPAIKQVLSYVACQLNRTVLPEVKQQEQIGQFSLFKGLALQHSAGDKPLGALLPQYSAEFLEHTSQGRTSLLEAIADCLQNASNINTHCDFITLMKVIDGMAYSYDILATEQNNTFHLKAKNYIAPTLEEMAIRAVCPNPVLAVTYGIGTKLDKDLVASSSPSQGWLSGKARFFIVPQDNRRATWFEQLAHQSKLSKPLLPLIASVSSSTARSFIMAQGLNLFVTDKGLWDINAAQIFANCLMAYFVYCGHHSVIEVSEVWNRQLDFVAIERPEQLVQTVHSAAVTHTCYMDEPNIPERILPYAIIGNHVNFLHTSYRDNVTRRLQEHSFKESGFYCKKG